MANVSSSNGLEKRPKLRFPGFDEPWKPIHLSDVGEASSGFGFPDAYQGENTLEIPFFKVSDMNLPQNVRVMQQANNYVSQATVKELRVRPFFEDAIVFAKVGAAISHERKRIAHSPFLIDNNMMAFTPKQKEDLEFIYHLFQRIKLSKYSQIGALPSYNASDILDIRTFYPTSKSERNKIVTILNLVSNRIEKQAEMITNLKKYKRGVVSSILTHQIKFADSEGKPYPEWTSCTLQDAVVFLDGQRKPLESADRAKRQGQYPYYGASGIIDYIDDYIFDEPLLLLGEDGANILNRSTPLCFIATGKYWVNNHAHVMRPKSGQNIKFLCELLESLDYTRYNTGTAQPKINQEKCREIKLSLPVYEEQCRIASFLATLDRRLERAQSNLNYLLLIRDGLLQQLFI